MNKKSIRCFIFGHIGKGNIGDDLMAKSLVSMLQNKGIYDIKILSPSLLSLKNVEYYKETIFSILQAIWNSDVLILNGGNYFHDKTKNPRFLFSPFIKLGGIFLLGYLLKKKSIMVGQGFGPFKSNWAGNWTKKIVNLTSYVGVRDHYSFEFLKNNKNVCFAHDSVFAIPAFGKKEQKKSTRVGINLVQFGKIYMNNPEIDIEIVKKFNVLLESLPKNYTEIVFFSFNEKIVEKDSEMYKLLKSTYKGNNNLSLVTYQELNSFCTEFSTISLFIGMRFHAHVLSILEKIPLISIPYHDKCLHLIEDFKIEKQKILIEDLLLGKIRPNIITNSLKVASKPDSLEIINTYLPKYL